MDGPWTLPYSDVFLLRSLYDIFEQTNSNNRYQIGFTLEETLFKRRGVREAQLHHNEEEWRGTTGERELSTNFWMTEDKCGRANYSNWGGSSGLEDTRRRRNWRGCQPAKHNSREAPGRETASQRVRNGTEDRTHWRSLYGPSHLPPAAKCLHLRKKVECFLERNQANALWGTRAASVGAAVLE